MGLSTSTHGGRRSPEPPQIAQPEATGVGYLEQVTVLPRSRQLQRVLEVVLLVVSIVLVGMLVVLMLLWGSRPV